MTWRRLAVVVTGLVAGCGAPGGPPAATAVAAKVASKGVLTVGSVSLQPTREYAVFRPFAAYLGGSLAAVGIGRGEAVVESSVGRLAERMRRGEVDLYVDSPFPVALMRRLAGARPLLRRWKDGQAAYRSVLFTRVDSGITTLDDLRGQMVAFGEPFSTSSFLMPKATLRNRGFILERYEDAAAEVPDDRIGYLFSGDSENTLFWVLKGRIAAGALNSGYFERLAGERRSELKILLETTEVPRHVVCCRPDLDPAVVAAVVRLLVGMDSSRAGREVLAAFDGTTRFDAFPQGGAAALQPIDELLHFVEEDLGG